MKYIFIVGGVMSGVGKGVASASIGKIMQSRGYKVTAVKIDPYINVDAGTMNPTEHGEVFVTEDGDETDQDIGTYERFLELELYSYNYMTTGRVYQSVIDKERKMGYAGKCVEVVPHIPEEIISRIKIAGEKNKSDIVMVEIGGTVGEYQNILFLEAARMLKIRQPKDVLLILVSYMPIPSKLGEMKTKPTQYAVRTLNSTGLQPDFLLCRGEKRLDKPRIEKLSVFCNVPADNIISAPDADLIYDIPLNFEKDNIGSKILKQLGLKIRKANWTQWKARIKNYYEAKKEVKIGIVGKYFGIGDYVLSDVYLSVIESLKHACWSLSLKPKLTWLDSEVYEKNPEKLVELSDYDGIVVPGGFGKRGVEGKIKAIEYVRKNKIPYFGLCYGMQLACVEFARNVLGYKDAHTTEVDPETKHPIIYIIPNQEFQNTGRYGGTMRLGSHKCILSPDSLSYKAYGICEISERHRHRYEFNNEYRDIIEKKGMIIAGVSPDNKLVEIIEIKDHPFFVATQFHPEFKTKFLHPHPLFVDFIKASAKK